jgi:CRISPR-associated protein Cst2
MYFITGVYAIHASAAALNNSRGENNVGRVKAIPSGRYEYPYVSAQAVRYWLRATLAELAPDVPLSPVLHGKSGRQQAFTEGNPLRYWDDDLFGYMRAERGEDKEKGDALTRIAPLRTSTLVSAAPTEIVSDFGVMARAEGHSIMFEHEFYRAVLVGQFSIDLSAVGTFTYRDKAGYRNLGKALIAEAEARGLEHLPDISAYRLPLAERQQRVAVILQALGRLHGGAKQALHYTDTTPAFVCAAVLRGGNNPFAYLIDSQPQPALHVAALDEALQVYADDFQSPLYLGLRQGFMDSAYPVFEARALPVMHPRAALDQLALDVEAHGEWFA